MFDPSTDQAIALYILNKYGEEYVMDLIDNISPRVYQSSERIRNVVRTWLWNINETGDETWEDES